MQTAFFVGRTILGLYFLMAGMMHFMKMRFMKDYAQSKHLPMPTLSVLMTGMVLMLGGLGVMLQLAIAWSYGVLIAFLVLAASSCTILKAQDPNENGRYGELPKKSCPGRCLAHASHLAKINHSNTNQNKETPCVRLPWPGPIR